MHVAGDGRLCQVIICQDVVGSQNSLAPSKKICSSTKQITSGGNGLGVCKEGGWLNSWSDQSHVVLLNFLDHKQACIHPWRSYLTRSAHGCIASQEWQRKHQQNVDKTLPSSACRDVYTDGCCAGVSSLLKKTAGVKKKEKKERSFFLMHFSDEDRKWSGSLMRSAQRTSLYPLPV